MRLVKILTVLCMMVGCLFGCGPKSKVEGTVIDGKAKPLAGIRVVAKNVKTGNEQHEVTTAADGKFTFAKIDAETEYEFIPYLDSKSKGRSLTSKTAPKGQAMVLPQVLPILFAPTKDGLLVGNTISGLLWIKDAAKGGEMDWQAAMELPKKFSLAGFSDWRLPTKDELRALAAYGGVKPAETLNNEMFANVKPDSYWTSNDEGNNSYAWAVNMADGKYSDDLKTTKHQVWLVRSGN